MVKIVETELTEIMGDKCEELDLKSQPPVVILLAGLQGSIHKTHLVRALQNG